MKDGDALMAAISTIGAAIWLGMYAQSYELGLGVFLGLASIGWWISAAHS